MNAMMVIKVQILANQATKALQQINTQMAATQAMTGRATAGVGAFNGALSLTALSKWGSQLQWAGRQLTYNFTAPLALAAGAATKWALDNERTWTRVGKVYGDAAQAELYNLPAELEALDKTMELLSEKFGVQRSVVNEIAGDWAAAGAAGKTLAVGVNETLRTMVLGELEAGEATTALIAIQAQYRLSTEELTEAVNILNVVENETGAQMPDLIAGMSRAAGTARTAGIDIEHLAALMAALVPTAGAAAASGNGLKTMVSRLMSPTSMAAELMEELGLNIGDIGWQSLNGVQRLEALAVAVDGLDEAQKTVIGTYVAGRYQINRFDVLMSDIASGNGYYAKALDVVGDSVSNAAVAFEELNAVLQSQPMKLQQMWVMLQNGLAKAIQPLIPVILNVVGTLASWAKAFGDMDPATQRLIIFIGLAVAAIGLLSTVVGAAATAIAVILRPLRFFIAAAAVLRGILSSGLVVALGKAVGAMMAFAKAANAKIFAGLVTGAGWVVKSLWLMHVEAGKVAVGMAASLGRTAIFAPIVAGAVSAATIMRNAFSAAILGIQSLIGLLAAGGITSFNVLAVIVRNIFGGLAIEIRKSLAAFMGGFVTVFGPAVSAIATGVSNAMSAATTLLYAGFGKAVAGIKIALAAIPAFAGGVATRTFSVLSVITSGMTTMFTTGFTGFMFVANRMVDAVVLAGSRMAAGFSVAWGAVTGFFATINAALMTAWTLTMTWMSTAAATAARWIGVAWAAIPKTTAAVGVLMTKVWAAVHTAMAAITRGFQTLMMVILPAIARAWVAIGPLVVKGWGMMTAALAGGMTKLVAFVKVAGAAIMAALTNPWVLAILAIAGVIALFWDEIKDFFAQFQAGWNAQAGGVVKAFEPLATWFNDMVGKIRGAFFKLPQGVQDALLAVVNIVKTAALKVYEWFSYLNPFQRHSPSLVESVTWGMAAVAKQYESIGNVAAPFKRAAADLKAFKTIAASMGQDEWADERQDVKDVMPQNLGNFNALTGHLTVFKNLLIEQGNAMRAQEIVVKNWKDQLDAANDVIDQQNFLADQLQKTLNGLQDAYDKSKAAVQDYASTALVGSRAYSDALFQNEMAQKRLQLALLDMDASQTEKVTDQMAKLRGEIEALQGTANDLQMAGAGSDILGPIKDQILEMENAYGNLGSGVGGSDAVSEMQLELERLQKEAERINLTESLELDPLRRQIEQAADSSRELTFQEIINGINTERAAMAALEPQIAAASAAYETQAAHVAALESARDVLQATYNAENASLRILKDEYDTTAQAIRDIEEALNGVAGAAKNAKDAMKGGAGGKDGALSPAMQNFMDAAGGNYDIPGGDAVLGREGGLPEIEDFNELLAADLGDMMGEFDMFGGIKEKWEQFKTWWGNTVTPAWNGLVGGLKGTWDSIDFSGFEEKFTGIRDRVQPILDNVGGFFSGVWDKLVVFGDGIATVFGPHFVTLWENVKNAVGPAFDRIKEAIGPAWEAFKGIWERIGPIVLGALGAVVAVVVGVVSGIVNALANIIGPVIDIVSSLIASIIQIATGIWNTLSGVFDIVWGLVQGIIGIFKGLFTGDWSWFTEGFKRVWDGIIGVFNGISQILGAIWSAIWRTIKGLIDIIVGAVSGFVQGIIDWFYWLWDVLVGHSIVPDTVNAIIDWFVTLWNNVTDWVKSLVQAVVDFFTNLWNDIVSIFQAIGDGIGMAWDAMVDALEAGWNWINDKVFDPIKTAAQWVADKFIEVKDNVIKGWNLLKDYMVQFYTDLATNTFDKIKQAVAWVADKFTEAKDKVIVAWGLLETGLKTVWEWIRDNVFDKIKAAVATVATAFETAKGGIGTAWDLMKSGVEGVWTYLRDNVFNRFKEGIEAIGTTFSNVKDTIGTAWDKVRDAARKPVNFIIEKVYTEGIKKVWDEITGAVGLKLTLPEVKTIPAFANGTEDHRAQIARGGSMRMWAEPETGGEAYIPLAAHKRGNSMRILRSVANRFGYGLTQFDNGGFWNNLKDKASSVGNWVKDAALNVAGFLSDPVNGIKDMISKPVEAIMKNIGGGKLGQALVELPRKSIEGLITKAKELIGIGGDGASGGVVGGVVPQVTGGWTRPMRGGRVTSEFGPRWGAFHNGIDLAGGGRTYSVWAGRVAKAGWNAGYGNTGIGILIDHANGLQSYYGHNPVGGVKVSPGQTVAAGQWIGHEGQTGRVTGTHLHHSIFKNGRAINPRSYGIFDNGGILKPGGVAHNLSGKPEAVFSSSQWALLSKVLDSVTSQRSDTIQRPTTVTQNFYFYGNLEFPNIESGDDVDEFLRNLTDIGGR